MPIYEYKTKKHEKGCYYCSEGFECLVNIHDPQITNCPKCKSPVEKLISVTSIGMSRSGLDDRAKNAGFTKLQRLGKGEYEKKY